MPSNPLAIGFGVPFHEAIRAAQQRGVVLPDVYYGELQGLARQHAFSIAGLASLDQLEVVRNTLSAALQRGVSFNKWKKEILESGTLELPSHRLDNIFRTNIQNSYNQGRWERFQEVKVRRPYLIYDAINDSRVRPSHVAMDGIIRGVDDNFWHEHGPSNGFRCRCRLINLSEKQAQARSGSGKGLNKSIIHDDMRPDKGWDYNPGADLTKGIQAAITSRKGRSSDMLLSALNDKSKQYASPIMKVINMGKGDILLLDNVASSLLDKRREWFPAGQVLFILDSSLIGFAQSLHGKSIKLSANDSQAEGFIPAKYAIDALEKMSKDEPLSFHDEYAIEIIWHEILHTRTPDIKTPTDVMEAVTQFVARHTYEELLNVLGGVMPQHFDEVLQSGYGYQTNIENFRYALNRLQINEKDFAKDLYLIYLQSGDDIRARTAGLMSKYNGKSASRNRKILGELNKETSDFKRIIEKILSRH